MNKDAQLIINCLFLSIFFPVCTVLLILFWNMHNDVDVLLFIWMLLFCFFVFLNNPVWVLSELLFFFFCVKTAVLSCFMLIWIMCIDGNDMEAEDNDDIVMYLNFWSMFCKLLLYRLCIQCHVIVVFCVSCTRLLIKSTLKRSCLILFHSFTVWA